MTHPKKLIEVALPLEAINVASAREKSIRHGHPSTLHLWWARRPLAAARAVIFAQMVDDPSGYVQELRDDPKARRKAAALLKERQKVWGDATRVASLAAGAGMAAPDPGIEPLLDDILAEQERERLFRIIEDLVKWENTTNEAVLQAARDEIWQSWRRTCARNADHPRAKELFDRNTLPAFHDPFAGGGALPLEAQRLGLESHASDLNPVAVLINKAMIEIPPKFAGRPPVHPAALPSPAGRGAGGEGWFTREWKGAQGLAEDVRYYGQWMRDEAEKRIGHLYPKIEVTAEMVKERPDLKPLLGQKLTVIAWLWARTVPSPNPAFAHMAVPLASTFMLSTKPGKEAYVQPVIEGDTYRFTVKLGKPKDAEAAKNGTKLARGANFRCIMSGEPMAGAHIKGEGMAGRMGARLMAIVAEGERGRVYLTPTPEHEAIAKEAKPTWEPNVEIPPDRRSMFTPLYGLTHFKHLFTSRQLVALTTFSDLVQEACAKVLQDALGARASRPQHEDEDRPEARAPGSNPGRIHTRGYLPHYEAGEHPQHITFRLHDSLPREVLARWEEELRHLPDTDQHLERRKRIEAALDSGLGACYLRQPEIAKIVENALLHFDGERYRLHAWVIMPNHVHVLVTPLGETTLSALLHSWKSFTAKEANRVLRRTSAFWQEEYFDRMIRDEKHFAAAVEYIHNNPVKAGLCARAEDWEAGSTSGAARVSRAGEGAGGTPAFPGTPLADGGTGAQAYADAVAVYLAFVVDKATDYWSTICTWHSSKELIRNTFGRQAIPMAWDFAETNGFSQSAGNISSGIDWTQKVLLTMPKSKKGWAIQADAQNQSVSQDKIVSTDPPYYDNIGYADLSDFFYVWLRHSLKTIYPELFGTLAVPKAEELVATPYRHGNKEKAEAFFLNGMTQAMHRLAEQAHPAFPVTIYYAFKQSESESEAGTTSTGWETFLDAVIRAGFALTGTWPMRTELSNRMIGSGTNALASSIVLVCRARAASAPTATRRDFLSALKAELPTALRQLQQGNIAPVDLAQAAIGPGMAVFTRYAQVLDAEGKAMRVREALALINQTLDETLAEQEGDFDGDTRWALAWFDQFGFGEGEYGVAETLSKAKNTSITGMVEAGILASKSGKVRLLAASELPADWDPQTDARLTAWEAVHHLVRVSESGGDIAAAALIIKLGVHAEPARELAYRLYATCERKKRAQEALTYNSLVQSWGQINLLAQASSERESSPSIGTQGELFSAEE